MDIFNKKLVAQLQEKITGLEAVIESQEDDISLATEKLAKQQASIDLAEEQMQTMHESLLEFEKAVPEGYNIDEEGTRLFTLNKGEYILTTDGIPNSEGHMKVAIDWDKTFIDTLRDKYGIYDAEDEHNSIGQFNTYLLGMVCGIYPSGAPHSEEAEEEGFQLSDVANEIVE